MAEHRPLGPPCGAGGVEDRGQIVRPARHVRFHGQRIGHPGEEGARVVVGRVPDAERLQLGADLLRDRADGGLVLRVAHHQCRFRVADEVGDFRGGVGGVERQEDRTRPHHGEVEHQGFDGFGNLHGHAVARLHAEFHEPHGEAARDVAHVAIGVVPGRRAGDLGEGCSVVLAGEQRVDEVVHRAGPMRRLGRPVASPGKIDRITIARIMHRT